MEFGAVLAYKRIDAQVEQTLQAAAEVLKNLELRAVLTDGRTVSERTESERSKVRKVEYKPVTLTNCSTSKCSSIGREPKATIRTPRDAQKCQKVFFPPARICSKSERDPSPESSNASASIATTPDSLFPSAIYIPAKKGGQIQVATAPRPSCEVGTMSPSPTSTSSAPRSVHRKYIQKLATEPLVDMNLLKCRGQKKSKPDSLFPKATYDAGTGKPKLTMSPVSSCTPTYLSTNVSTTAPTGNSTESSSLIYEPMEFISKDGRVKMLLQPLETVKSVKRAKSDDFPNVPRQLESHSNLLKNSPRTKFTSQVSIAEKIIDVSGIFHANRIKKRHLAKVVINGQAYSLERR